MKVEVVVDTPEPPNCELSIDSVSLSPETLYLIGSCVLNPSIAPSTVLSELKVNVWLMPSSEVFHVPTSLLLEQAVRRKAITTSTRMNLNARLPINPISVSSIIYGLFVESHELWLLDYHKYLGKLFGNIA